MWPDTLIVMEMHFNVASKSDQLRVMFNNLSWVQVAFEEYFIVVKIYLLPRPNANSGT